MMQEVVKKAAQRFAFLPRHFGPWTLGQVKVTIAIQSWGSPDTFEVDANYLEELIRVTETLGAKFTITEVEDFKDVFLNIPIFRLIVARVAQQGEGLSKLRLKQFSFSQIPDVTELFFSLQRAAKEWSVSRWVLFDGKDWETLAWVSTNGSINKICFHTLKRGNPQGAKQDDVKKVWKITDKVFFRHLNGASDITIGGGKEEGMDAEWQRMLEVVFGV